MELPLLGLSRGSKNVFEGAGGLVRTELFFKFVICNHLDFILDLQVPKLARLEV